MDDKQFECALWGTSWDDVFSDREAQQGVASFSGREGIRLDIPFGEILPSDMFGEVKKADFIYGFCRSGDYLVLGSARSFRSCESFPGGKKQGISADFVLKSRTKFDPSIKMQGATLRLKGLREWLGEAPITMIHYPERKKLDITMVLDKASSIILSENNPKISIEHHITTSALTTEGINLIHDCFLDIEFDVPLTIKEIEQEVIRPVQKFLSYCIGKHASIVELKFRQVDFSNVIEYFKRFASSEKDISETDNMPLPYRRIKANLPLLFSSWKAFRGDLERGVSLLVSLLMIEWKMPTDLQFLASAQMLEALSRHEQATEELSRDTFAEYTEVVRSSIEDKEVRVWALKKLEHSNYVSQRKLLKNLLDRLGIFSQYLLQDEKQFLNNHLRLRNAYTHRSDDCESSKLLMNAELYWHMQTVLFLSYGAVLVHLKYTPEEVIAVFTKSNYEWYKINKIKEMYSKK